MSEAAERIAQGVLSGPKPVRVGKTTFGVPMGSQVAHAQGERLAYVLTGGTLFVLTESGEVEIPPQLRHELASRYFGGRRT